MICRFAEYRVGSGRAATLEDEATECNECRRSRNERPAAQQRAGHVSQEPLGRRVSS